MVRNRSINWLVNNWKQLGDKLSSAVLFASAIAVWLVIIAAIIFLMLDNGSLRESLRYHDRIEIRDEQERAILRQSIIDLENRKDIKDIDNRLRALENAHAHEVHKE